MIQKICHITSIFFFLLTVSVVAQNKSRKQLELERSRIKKEIKMVNKLLFETQKKEKNILEELKDLNQKITIREQLITTINLELKSLSNDIFAYEQQIEKQTQKLNLMKEDYASMIYKSYKSKSQQSRTLFLFSSESFYQAYKRLKYMNQYASFRKKQGEEVFHLKNKLLNLKDSLAYQKELKDTLLSSEEEQKLKILDEKQDQQTLISQIKKKEKKYKKELRQKQEKEKKL